MSESSPIVSIIAHSDYVRMPWKNGLGETLEIAVRHRDDQIWYRVSQASVVEEGAFSDFSGLHRTLVLLKGNGMRLCHQSATAQYCHDLHQPLSIARFSGGDTTHASLPDGPIDDLNIMVREGQLSAAVDAVLPMAAFRVEHAEHHVFNAFYANSDCVLVIECQGETQTVTVSSQDTVCFHQAAQVTVYQGSGVKICVIKDEIRPHSRMF